MRNKGPKVRCYECIHWLPEPVPLAGLCQKYETAVGANYGCDEGKIDPSVSKIIEPPPSKV